MEVVNSLFFLLILFLILCQIKQKLKDYGVEGVEHITLVSDTQNEGLSRGFAFLEFSCHEDAMLAYKRLQKPDVIFGHPDRTAKVAFAEPLRAPDPEVMSQVLMKTYPLKIFLLQFSNILVPFWMVISFIMADTG